jgi:hypothetical protein
MIREVRGHILFRHDAEFSAERRADRRGRNDRRRLDGWTAAGRRGRLTRPDAALDRDHRPPSLSEPPAPDPLFEVEHLGLRAAPEAQKELRREQRDVTAGGAIDLDEIAPAKILDVFLGQLASCVRGRRVDRPVTPYV